MRFCMPYYNVKQGCTTLGIMYLIKRGQNKGFGEMNRFEINIINFLALETIYLKKTSAAKLTSLFLMEWPHYS